MAEAHVISALRTKRAEISGYIHDLEKRIARQRANLANLDATIRLFAPGSNPDAIPPKRTYRRTRYMIDARESSERQLRAYMAIDPLPLKDFAKDIATQGGVKITSKGQTPAYDVTLITYIATLPYPPKEDIRLTASPVIKGDIISTILTPGQSTKSYVTLGYAPNESQFQIIKDGKTYRLYVWGEANYMDTFKKKRLSRFCYSYDGIAANGGDIDLCPRGNCADEQCND
jgi:hypothetical protein